MTHALLIAVRLHEGRYHGTRDGFDGTLGWPPSPGRLFQALVAAAARGASIPPVEQDALRWLEELQPPDLAAPSGRQGESIPQFVPNNDLDTVGGDPARIGGIRASKHWRPIHFDPTLPIRYVWRFEPPVAQARTLCNIATRLYQLGRGLDMASATAEIMTADEVQKVLSMYEVVRSPGRHGEVAVACPGTLDSLVARHQGARSRLQQDSGTTVFVQPPRARFRHIGYNAPPRRLHFELRDGRDFVAQPLHTAGVFIANIRDAAANRLIDHFPNQARLAERFIVGRGAGPRDAAGRCRILPIPSLGTEHTDPSIRRVVVELPTEFPFAKEDMGWAFSGLAAGDQATSDGRRGHLVATEDATMMRRYTQSARLFRSITAVALTSTVELTPGTLATRRRRDEHQAIAAVRQALLHAGVHTEPTSIHVQREPLHRRGDRTEVFATGTRFPRRAMWHVELMFPEKLAGPITLGDGRFVGLGLMVPVVVHDDIVGFPIPHRRVASRDASGLLRALRRALMSVARDEHGGVDKLFSGHETDGRPDSAGHHGHVFLAADVEGDWVSRLVVAAPWTVDRSVSPAPKQRRLFDHVVRKLTFLRSGRLGVLPLKAVPLDDDDDMMCSAKTWRTTTSYVATRNVKQREDANAVLITDVAMECRRRGLPTPNQIHVTAASHGPRGGRPTADVVISFAISVRGPVLLGRNSHKGAGLFHPELGTKPSSVLTERANEVAGSQRGEQAAQRNLANTIRDRFAPLGGVDLDVPPREPMGSPPTFD